MKRAGIVLLVISVIALIIMLFMELAWWSDGSRRSSFLSDWTLTLLFPLMLPLIGRNITIRLTVLKPRIWLIIHGAVALIWLLAQLFSSSMTETTKDLPLCINRDYSTTTITAQTISTSKHSQTIASGRAKFKLEKKDFYPVTRGGTYRIIYLPNSKYVIDIIDDDRNISLLRR